MRPFPVADLDSDIATYTDPATECPLHHVPLQEETVPIVYGMLVESESERAARLAQFPYARLFLNPGCSEERATSARVRFCPICRRAAQAWADGHPGPGLVGDTLPH